MTLSLSVSRSPYEILFAAVSENKNDSCGTKPIFVLRMSSGIFLTSIPSIKTSPDVTSYKRGIKFMNEVFPEPVCPTIARVVPLGIFKLMLSRIKGRCSAYLNETFLNSISPFISEIDTWV